MNMYNNSAECWAPRCSVAARRGERETVAIGNDLPSCNISVTEICDRASYSVTNRDCCHRKTFYLQIHRY